MTEFVFLQGDIVEQNAALLVYMNKKDGMVSSYQFKDDPSWGMDNINELNTGKLMALLSIEYASDEENIDILDEILEYCERNNVKSLALNGVRDVDQQHLSEAERNASQNRRCVNTVQHIMSAIYTKGLSLDRVIFCSKTKDYYGKVFKDFNI